ncbi:MAG: metal-dependent hydrolase [Nanoarchaeota archaeon]|nr:metal-dependent hydrolase [Nanoarchaeota archaeon]MBU1028407.1 metal-dependent hydrolase [Nanoarchaeota archaeon]
MPYTTTHVLVSIILIELFREYFFKNNKKFPRYYILIAAIAGIIPDLEYIFQLPEIHRGFLHSLFAPLIFLLIGLFILKFDIKNNWIRKRHLKLSFIFFIFAAGSLLHIFLDAIIRDGSSLFYPFSDSVFGLNLISYIPLSQSISLIFIDTLLLFFWIFWMEFKLKINDYF